MQAIVICFFFWVIAICGETFLFSEIPWINPNLLFLFPCLLCLRWRGRENYYIITFFGLTADCFSTLPFGIHGLSYILFAFFGRWYAVKIYQDESATLPIITGVFTLTVNLITFVILSIFFESNQLTWQWIRHIVLYRVLVTALLSIPSYHVLVSLEKKFRVHLAERKF